MDFGKALIELKGKKSLRRNGWNGIGLKVMLRDPDGEITVPYFTLSYPSGQVATWVPSVTDLLAIDWVVVEE